MKRLTQKIALLLLVVMGISLTALAVTDEINRIAEQADKLYVQKRYNEAFPLMKYAAEGGDVISMFNLGTMYYEGQGTKQDLAQARHWWQEAAKLGDTKAQNWLARVGDLDNYLASAKKELERGNYQEAIDLARKVLDVTPDDQTALGIVSKAVVAQKEIEQNRVINNLANMTNMVYVEGGTFIMGATAEQGREADGDEKPPHIVSVDPFYISKYEVTQAEWQAVMGSNPSRFNGDNMPVENVSWDDCQEFIRKLNSITGKNFRLPTEAEWEYAARGGNKSKEYKYSGSNTIGDVAWYEGNSGRKTHPVGTKAPNELGLYDMSGNVWEWCQDWYGEDYYSSSPSSNPTGPSSGSYRVRRGGSWSSARFCRVSDRGSNSPGKRLDYNGLRLVAMTEQQAEERKEERKRAVLDLVTMVHVEGGTFMMGSKKGDKDEKPEHQVTVSSFHIGKYEVTQALWEAVMGSNPSKFKGDNLPVEQVSWDDCQEFIRELNRLTGKNFRLPTEAEWEYAARGGNKSKGYKYAGSKKLDAVAWYKDNSGSKTHPVGTKAPNELGLYDMTGNVREWCQDWYGEDYYSSSPSSNPTGPTSGSNRVCRGGGWCYDARYCRVSYRGWHGDRRNDNLGLRLAL